MISEKTFKILRNTLTLAYNLRILPWQWDEKTRRLFPIPTKTQKRKFICCTWFHILVRILLLIYLVLTVLLMDLPQYEAMTCIVLIAIMCSSITLFLLPTIRRWESWMRIFGNGCLLFDEKQMIFHQLPLRQVDSDNNEKIAQLFIGMCVAIFCLIGPTALWILALDWEFLWITRLWIFNFAGFNLLFSISVACLSLFDLCIHSVFALSAISIGNCITLWLGYHICRGPITTESEKSGLRLLIRGQRVLNRNIEETIYIIVPFVFLLALVLNIAFLYLLISQYQILNGISILFAANFVLISIFVFSISCKIGNTWEVSSMAYTNSFLELDTKLTLMDKKFFRSVKPIVLPVGPFVVLNNALFPSIIDFVGTRVVDLLVM